MPEAKLASVPTPALAPAPPPIDAELARLKKELWAGYTRESRLWQRNQELQRNQANFLEMKEQLDSLLVVLVAQTCPKSSEMGALVHEVKKRVERMRSHLESIAAYERLRAPDAFTKRLLAFLDEVQTQER